MWRMLVPTMQRSVAKNLPGVSARGCSSNERFRQACGQIGLSVQEWPTALLVQSIQENLAQLAVQGIRLQARRLVAVEFRPPPGYRVNQLHSLQILKLDPHHNQTLHPGDMLLSHDRFCKLSKAILRFPHGSLPPKNTHETAERPGSQSPIQYTFDMRDLSIGKSTKEETTLSGRKEHGLPQPVQVYQCHLRY